MTWKKKRFSIPTKASGFACVTVGVFLHAYALGTNRQTLLNYEEKEEFFDTIKGAKAKIELFNEEMLYNKDVSTTGVIFNLKNNYGWKDKQEIEADVKNDVTINIELTDDE